MAKLERKPGYITEFLEGRRKVSHGTSLYYLRECELSADEAVILAPFIQAYRPHSEVPKRAELQEDGYELVRKESFTEELEDYYFELKGYYPEEAVEFATTPPRLPEGAP